jgi:hypothetical protein
MNSNQHNNKKERNLEKKLSTSEDTEHIEYDIKSETLSFICSVEYLNYSCINPYPEPAVSTQIIGD